MRLLESSNRGEIAELRQKRAEKEQLPLQKAKLMAETKRHALHYKKLLSRIDSEKKLWFSYEITGDDDDDDENRRRGREVRAMQIKQALAHCILPRAVHSPVDATFCARFVKLMHSLGTVNFSSLSFFDKLFSDDTLYITLLTCTTYEAENLGLFLSQLLEELERWRKSEEAFGREGLGRQLAPDGTTSYLPGLIIRYADSSMLDYDRFCGVLEKWHRNTTNTILTCLKSKEYMHRHNTITLLKNMISVFPEITSQGWSICDAIEGIAKEEDREDLKLSATALLGHLTRRENAWIPMYEFKKVNEETKKKIVAAEEARKAKKSVSKPKADQLDLSREPSVKPSPASTVVPTGPASRKRDRSPEKAAAEIPASLPRIPNLTGYSSRLEPKGDLRTPTPSRASPPRPQSRSFARTPT